MVAIPPCPVAQQELRERSSIVMNGAWTAATSSFEGMLCFFADVNIC